MKKPSKPKKPIKNANPPPNVDARYYRLFFDRDRKRFVFVPYTDSKWNEVDTELLEFARNLYAERKEAGVENEDLTWVNEVLYSEHEKFLNPDEYLEVLDGLSSLGNKDLKQLIAQLEADENVQHWTLEHEETEYGFFSVNICRKKDPEQHRAELKKFNERFEKYQEALAEWEQRMKEYEEWKKQEDIKKLEAQLQKLKK